MTEKVIYFIISISFMAVLFYYIFNIFVNKRINLKKNDKQQSVILPLRLQAFERMTLFLERIRPKNLLLRTSLDNISVKELHERLLSEIRTELNHNIAQQVYISSETWDLIILAVSKTQNDLHQIFASNTGQISTLDMAKLIMQNADENIINEALKSIKNEVKEFF